MKTCTCGATRRCRSWSVGWAGTSATTTASGGTSRWTTGGRWRSTRQVGERTEGGRREGEAFFFALPPSALVKGGRAKKNARERAEGRIPWQRWAAGGRAGGVAKD